MSERPDRPALDEPADRVQTPPDHTSDGNGWGSPLPAGYGSLHDPVPPRPSRNGSNGDGLMSSLLKRLPNGSSHPRSAPAGGAGPARPSPAAAPPAAEASPRPPTARPSERPAARPSPAGPAAPDARRAEPPTAVPTGSAAATGPVPAAMPRSGAVPPARAPGPRPTPAATPPARPTPEPEPARRRRRGRSFVTSRGTVRHVDVASVAKISLLFYLVVLVIFVVADVILWYAADAFGTLPSIEKSVRTLFSLKSFQLHVGAVAGYTAAAGLLISFFGTLANIILALVYNLISDVVGGLRVEVDQLRED